MERKKRWVSLKRLKLATYHVIHCEELSKKVDVSPSKFVIAKLGRKPIIGNELEKQLAPYLLHMEAKFRGVTLGDLRRMAFQLAIKNDVDHPVKRKEKQAALESIYFYIAKIRCPT